MIKGDRVRLNDRYRATFKVKNPDRLGTVVGLGRNLGKDPQVVWVWWDGTKESSRGALHESFLEVVA